MQPERFRVLVVDDNAADRLLYRLSLRMDRPDSRFDAVDAASGKLGIEACKHHLPDCIVLDYNMPGMDGLEFLSALKVEFGGMPCAVVMLTGVQDEVVAVRAMKSGATDYVPKTEKIGEVLEQSITGAIEKFRMRRQIEEQRAALEASERKYRALMEGTPQLVWLARDDGTIVYGNGRWSEYTGLRAPNAPRALRQIIFADDEDRYWGTWRRGVELSTPFEFEVRLRRASDGSSRWHLISVVPVEDFPDVGSVWLGTCVDIEDNKQAQRAIQQMQKWESIGILAGGIAHDFNNLLTIILGYTNLVADTLPSVHPAQGMLKAIVTSSERAAQLTRQMLAYSGKAPFFAAPADLSSIVRQTCEFVRSSIPANVRLQLETDDTLPQVQTDAGQMQQVIVNLVINAAEAIPEGQPGAIVVRTFTHAITAAQPPAGCIKEPVAGTYVVLEVQDTGAGINEETKARIFDPFFTTKFTGRGLGLAAVQGIVRSSEGCISVESTPGAGSTFRVFFPGLQVVAFPKHEEVVSEKGPRQNPTILIIDDEEAVRNVARLALERAGYQVVLAEGGEAGLKILEQRHDEISLVLLDMGMPGMSGKDVLTRMRESGINTPVAVCSGYSEPEVLRNFAGCEFSEFIQKPFTLTDLPERIQKVLRGGAGIKAERKLQDGYLGSNRDT